MQGDLFINGKDAWTEYGITMGDGFLDAVGAQLPLKDFFENKSLLKNGKIVLYPDKPRLDERELTLTFNIHGKDSQTYLANKKKFEDVLYRGRVAVGVGANNETYHLTYLRSQSFSQSRSRTSCRMSVKFNEPDPSFRFEYEDPNG